MANSKKILTLIILVITSYSFSLKAQDKWLVDQAHSSVQFTVSHLVISSVTGSFGSFNGSVTQTNNDFSSAIIEGEIEVNTLTTGNEDRDGHLMSADFFDAANYALIHFNSLAIKKLSSGQFEIKGSLRIRDVEKEVTLLADHRGSVMFQEQQRAAIQARGVISRFDFGLKWNSLMETGGAIVGDEVTIELIMELVKQE